MLLHNLSHDLILIESENFLLTAQHTNCIIWSGNGRPRRKSLLTISGGPVLLANDNCTHKNYTSHVEDDNKEGGNLHEWICGNVEHLVVIAIDRRQFVSLYFLVVIHMVAGGGRNNITTVPLLDKHKSLWLNTFCLVTVVTRIRIFNIFKSQSKNGWLFGYRRRRLRPW